MLDNLLPWLQRRSEKLCYSFVCFAGASMWHSGAGEVWCGKRGKKEFIVYAKNGNPFTDPHMHMILFGNPADALAKLIKSYLKENGIELWYSVCDKRMETAVPYVTLQCVKCRTASCNVEQLPQAALAEFFKIAEYNSKIRGGCAPVFKGLSDCYYKQNAHDLYHINTDLFINMDEENTPETLELPITIEDSGNLEEPQCNNIIYKYNNPLYKDLYKTNKSNVYLNSLNQTGFSNFYIHDTS